MRIPIYLVATVCSAVIPAFSQAAMPDFLVGGTPYIGLAGGWTELEHTEIDPLLPDGRMIKLHLKHDTGWAGLGTVGYSTPSGIRGELEFGYRANNVNTALHPTASIQKDVEGKLNAWTVMANALYDYHNKTAFTPYIGIGAGAIDIHFDDVHVVGGVHGADHDVWAPALQGIVGVAYRVRPNINLFVNYQYLEALGNPKITGVLGNTAKVTYETQSLLVGVRFAFNKPKPAVVEPALSPAEN